MYTRWCRGGTKRDVDHDFVVDRMPHKGAEEGGGRKKEFASQNRQTGQTFNGIHYGTSRRLSFFLFHRERTRRSYANVPLRCRLDWRNPTYEKNLAPPGVSARPGGFNAQVLRPSRACDARLGSARLGSEWIAGFAGPRCTGHLARKVLSSRATWLMDRRPRTYPGA